MSAPLVLRFEPLTRTAFATFGNVIEAAGESAGSMNAGTLERFDNQMHVDVGDDDQGAAQVSIVRCRRPFGLPLPVDVVERHPLGSQAFIPLTEAPMGVVVAPPGERVDPQALRAFITDGHQGVNYKRGVWHMPIVVLEKGQRLLVIERGGPGANYDEFHFDIPIVLER